MGCWRACSLCGIGVQAELARGVGVLGSVCGVGVRVNWEIELT